MKLPRVRQASVAAGRRSGNSSQLPLPEPTLAAVVMTMAWILQLAVVGNACLPAAQRTRADFLGMGDQRWEWQSRPSRRCLASGRGVQSLQDGKARRDSHHRQCSSGACAPLATRSRLTGVPEVFWQTLHRAIALLGVETALGKRCLVCHATREPPRTLGPRDGH